VARITYANFREIHNRPQPERLDVWAAGKWRAPMRNVLMTCGSRGIGLAIAHKLTACGDYKVIAVARRESEDLDRLHFKGFDLDRTDMTPTFVKELRSVFGAIYGLVNNAGIAPNGCRPPCAIPRFRRCSVETCCRRSF
jgi:NAD(P)-dependent dehydrogenase (short-subunit alcohol dehydrogenase family)